MLIGKLYLRRAVRDITDRHGFNELVLAHFEILEYRLAIRVSDKGFRPVLGGNTVAVIRLLRLDHLALAVL